MHPSKREPYFTLYEKALWLASIAVILLSFLLAGSGDLLTLAASLIGATFLILNAKGNVWGQVLTVVFSVLYGVISYATAYYGEMITYLGMTAPIAVASVVSWARHPVEKGKNEVRVTRLEKREYLFLAGISLLITAVFYFILKAFHTSMLWLSTVSVLTSFVAAYLTMRRSEYFALGYAANDIVLILLWVSASLQDARYTSVAVCFAVFFINDLYGFANWSRMKKAQCGAACAAGQGCEAALP